MGHNFEQAVVDTDDTVAKLDHFYRNPRELRDLGERCHAFARRFEWAEACRAFVELVESVEKQGGHSKQYFDKQDKSNLLTNIPFCSKHGTF
jgi:hypothetical protein